MMTKHAPQAWIRNLITRVKDWIVVNRIDAIVANELTGGRRLGRPYVN